MTTQAPGPRPMPVIGTAYSINPARLLESATALARKYGEIYLQQIPGKAPLYIISSHRLVDELFDETRFKKVIHPAIAHVEPFAGNGLFTAETDDPDWEKGHRILMPAFSPIALRGMYSGMADVAEQLLLKWTRTQNNEAIDVTEDFTRLTLDTIALCSFSYRFNSFYSEGMHPFVDAMVGGLHESGRRAHAIDIQKKMMVYSQRKFDGYIETMHDTVDKLIADRKNNPHRADNRDILDIMLTAEDPVTGENLSDENVRFQLVNFLIAGHETTSGMLSFTLNLLLRNPNVFTKARRVVDEVLGGRFPEYDDLPKLAYLDQIFRESLRLYPTAPGLAVTPFETTTIGGPHGYVVNPGDTLFVLIPLLHRDPTIWDDPERFDPNRFSFENAQKIPVSAWKPFGNGQRSCIGRAFSLQESTIVLALLLQHLDFDVVDEASLEGDLEIKETLTIKPGDFKIFVRPRPGHEYSARRESSKSHGIDTGSITTAESGSHNPEGPAQGHSLRVFVGSNAGTCRSFGQRIVLAAQQHGFEATLSELNDAVDDLKSDMPTIIVSSSYEGLPPDNAKKFVEWITGDESNPDLCGVPFAVFGSGNSQWAASYQRIPTLIDDALVAHGAHRLHARGTADVQTDFESSFTLWQSELWASLAHYLDIELSTEEIESAIEIAVVDEGRAEILNANPDVNFFTGVVSSNCSLMTATSVESGQGMEGITEKRRVDVRLPKGVTYELGDYIDILPKNSKRRVRRFLSRFTTTGERRVRITSRFPGLPTETPISIEELLSGYFELGQPATREGITALANSCPCPPEAAELLSLLEGERFETEVLTKRITLLDLLEKYESVQMDVEETLRFLPIMKPRRYSISSSPLVDPQLATLTFSVGASPAWSGIGNFEGTASNYLATVLPGDAVSAAIVGGPEHFGPEDQDDQLILVGAGSGIAPLKAFLDHLLARTNEDARPQKPHILYFGCHHSEIDFLYRDSLAKMQEVGLVEVRPAFSRDEESPYKYVQDRLWNDRKEIAVLLSDGARILVCGDAEKMGHSVRTTVVDILSEEWNVDSAEAEEMFRVMSTQDFTYVSDLFD